MKRKLDELINLMSEQLSESDLIASEQLANISSQIVASRIERKMTQKEFAEFMDVSQGMISKWESENYNFTVETLAKICEKLNLELEINFKNRNSRFVQHTINKGRNWNCKPSSTISILNNGVA